MDFVIRHSYLIPLLPLLGAAVAGFFGARYLKQNSHWPIWLGVGGSAVLSFTLLFGMLGRWHPHEEGAHGAAAEHAAAADIAPAAEERAQPAAAQQPRDADAATADSETGVPEFAPPEFPKLAFGRNLYTWIRAG